MIWERWLRLADQLRLVLIVGAATPAASATVVAFPPPASPVALQPIFHARSPWQLEIMQGADTEDYGGNPSPGALTLCLRRQPTAPCDRKIVTVPVATVAGSDVDWGPHYLMAARPVYPAGAASAPLFEIVTTSLNAGDGGQIRATLLLKYNRGTDAFAQAYAHATGTNNNQEVRFIASGPLRGSVVSAEPTSNPPYGYWITVHRLTPAWVYLQALHYRSATRYGDGNPLPAIDSEMPTIQKRLGYWKPGGPLPVPSDRHCAKPRLKKAELWCE